MKGLRRDSCLIHVLLCFTTIVCAVHFEAGDIYDYSYVTDLALNEANEQNPQGAHKPVGFKFSGELRLTVVWKRTYDYLIKLDVTSSQLHSVSRESVSTDFKELRRNPVYFHWNGEGKVERVYLPLGESTISANLKKGIISMLQMQTVDGERTEVDASGECDVEYLVIGNKVTKKKTNCKNLEKSGQYNSANQMFDSTRTSMTTATYEFANDVITSADSVDKHIIYLNADRAIDISARATQMLRLKEKSRGGATVEANTVAGAVEAVDPESKLDLIGMLLGTDVDSPSCLIDCVSLTDAVKEVQKDLKTEKMAEVESPKAFIKLLPIMRQSSKDQIQKILSDNKDILPQLLDVVAAAQTESAVSAAVEFLKAEKDYRTAERLVMATSFASHPTESMIGALLEMFKNPGASPELHQSVALALGAVTKTYCQFEEQCSSKIVEDVEESLVEALKLAKEPQDALVVVRAMRNACLHGTTTSLIEVAETSTDHAVISAALQALTAISSDFASINVLEAMSRIYHQNDRNYDSGVRTAALAVLLSAKSSVQEIRNVMLSTVNQTDKHIATYVLGTMLDLASHKPGFKSKFMDALNDTRIKNYHSMSPGGKANALTSFLGKSEFTDISYRLFMQNAQTGIMKKSGMQVNVEAGAVHQPALLFSIYAQGLESFVDSSAVPEGMEPEEPTAGLSLDLLDVLLRPVEFFKGQSALMSAVWNAPSEPVTALAMNVLAQDKSHTIYVQNGIVLQHDLLGVASIKISGFISISLWNQDAHSVLKNSGSTAVSGGLSIANNNYLSAAVNFDLNAAAFIEFITDVNFYVAPPQVCLRMSLDPFDISEIWNKTEQASGIRKKAVYSLRRTRPVAGGSYLLSEENSKQCTKLLEK